MTNIFLMMTLCMLGSCSFLKNYPQDNIAEEIVEDVIEKETGINVDLSPLTPEKIKF